MDTAGRSRRCVAASRRWAAGVGWARMLVLCEIERRVVACSIVSLAPRFCTIVRPSRAQQPDVALFTPSFLCALPPPTPSSQLPPKPATLKDGASIGERIEYALWEKRHPDYAGAESYVRFYLPENHQVSTRWCCGTGPDLLECGVKKSRPWLTLILPPPRRSCWPSSACTPLLPCTTSARAE